MNILSRERCIIIEEFVMDIIQFTTVILVKNVRRSIKIFLPLTIP